MRPQYHFRDSPDGLMAWDIRKIIAQTADIQPRDIPLADIAELDEDWWFAHGESPTPRAIADHVKLVQPADRSYPIILDAEGRLMDGMHRVAQALMAGDTTIKAIRLPHTHHRITSASTQATCPMNQIPRDPSSSCPINFGVWGSAPVLLHQRTPT